jgi:uncharacterized protein (UPF0332 family)
MRPEVEGLIDKARRSLRWAEEMFAAGDSDFAVSRAYYAMFYLAEAMLRVEGLKFHKHSAVTSAFGYQFARTKRVDPKYHRYLQEGFDERNLGDYKLMVPAEAKARQCIAWAREFLAMAEEWLNQHDVADSGPA